VAGDDDNDDWGADSMMGAWRDRYYDLEGLWVLQKNLADQDPNEGEVDVEDLEPLPDLDDVPGGWNPWDQTVQK
jgi:hypothetical protein